MTSWKLSSSGAQRRGVTWPSSTIHTPRCRKSFLIDCLSSLRCPWNNRALRVVVVSHRSWESYASQRVILCFFFFFLFSPRKNGEGGECCSIFLPLPYFSRKHRDLTSFHRDFGREAMNVLLWETCGRSRAPVSISALSLVPCFAVTLLRFKEC